MKRAPWVSTLIAIVSFSLAGAGCDHKRETKQQDQKRENAQRWDCINHLQIIEGAKEQWTVEHHKTVKDVPTWADIEPYLNKPGIAKCPADGVYTLGRLDQVPTCSIREHKR